MPKILIIGSIRSGTTSLVRGLGRVYGKDVSGEPWNYEIPRPKNYKMSYNQVLNRYDIIKTLVLHLPKEFENKVGLLEFYEDLIPRFDSVILLTRENTIDIAKSLARQQQFGDSNSWHSPYVLADTTEIDISRSLPEAQKMKDTIELISKKFNIPITLYEKLYSGNDDLIDKEINKWGLGITKKDIYEYINPAKRYRRTKETLV